MAKILIVEDELQWSILEEDALKKAGHEVVCTIAANEAWDLLEIAREGGKPFKLAVIDLVRIPRVPEGRAIKGEGLRLLKKLRSSKQYAKLPIVCTTVWLQSDSSLPSWESVARDAGANEFFEQPVDLDKLAEVVGKLL